jgi:adenylate cyclase
MDYAAAGLLDGLEGPEREARIKLLESLAAEGFTLEQLKAAVAEDRLALLPVERVLGGSYTARDIEEQTGLPAQTMMRIRRSLGLPAAAPDERIFCQEDVEAARSIAKFLDAGFSEDAVSELSRVLGEAMSRVSGAAGTTFAETFLKPGETEHDVAWRFAELAENLTPAFEPVLAAAFRAHVLDNVRRAVISRAELAAGQVAPEQDTGVCFADLVGFTRLGSELETRTLGDVVGTFGELAGQAAEPPVRLVKTIGDAAMLVCREPRPLVEAALSLVESVEAADLPAVRAGVAWGPAVPRSGDLYGHAVNLASRVTGIARPGSVLCTEEVRRAAEDFDWSFAGRHRLKGIGEAVPLHRARRPAPATGDQAEVRKPRAGRRRR